MPAVWDRCCTDYPTWWQGSRTVGLIGHETDERMTPAREYDDARQALIKGAMASVARRMPIGDATTGRRR
jgi:hypothetical protein